MSIKIEEYEQYNVKGYTLQSIIECAYRFGRQDERYGQGDDKLVESMEQVMKMLEGFDSFKEINADKHK
tara:strand:- start:274 stop:480 length:207 start_codon:yes stop_codon:yes gene_type:complete